MDVQLYLSFHPPLQQTIIKNWSTIPIQSEIDILVQIILNWSDCDVVGDNEKSHHNQVTVFSPSHKQDIRSVTHHKCWSSDVFGLYHRCPSGHKVLRYPTQRHSHHEGSYPVKQKMLGSLT